MKNRVSRSASLAVLIFGVVGAGHAMGQADALDTDGDGMVSYTEALMAMPEMTEEAFSALDADGDGLLSAEELTAAEEAGLIPSG
jgi:Ca2+-binding EF-hand superfamily protein